MEALVYFLPDQLHEESVRGLPVVVIDVLRAATSILTALAAGARGVIPAESLEAATELAVKLGRDDVLLCAEYDGYRVAGCDLGNSPSEYTPEAVRDRLLVMATTNGTRAILSARAAGRVLIGAYVNASRLVEALAGERRVAFVCSGHDGGFALEDAAFAGHLLHRLAARTGQEVIPLNDGAWVALEIGRRSPKTPLRILRQSVWGRALEEKGFGSDLHLCAEVDARPVLGLLRERMIVRAEL
jgi:2-phosphosulfolactate phosphatase